MNAPIYRQTYAEIDLDAITHNLRFFQKRLQDKVKIMAVIKANAYGHGSIPIAKHLESLEVPYFAVSCVGEGIELRNAGIKTPILILGYTSPEAIEAAILHALTITVFSTAILDQINNFGKKLKRKLKVHIKVDTGMGRIGLAPEEVEAFLHFAMTLKWIEIEGIFTHFAKADEKDKNFTWGQFEKFTTVMQEVGQSFLIPYVHLSNSAAMIDLPELTQTMARLGIGLYGLSPSSEVNITKEDLIPVLSLKTKVSHLKKINQGQSVSYGATFIAQRETWVATLPIGYADGISRGLSNKGFVLVKGEKAPIIGRICMDQMMIDVTDIDGVEVGSEVVIIGKQGEQIISVDDIAQLLNTINYELITLIGRRIPRVYITNGKIVSITNSLLKGEMNES